MTGNLRIRDASASHVGNVRAVNEDSLASILEDGVWVVADGMGGHFDGRFASQTIVDTVGAEHYPSELDAACDAIASSIQSANRAIFLRSRELDKQMGSTVVALVVRGEEFVVLWAGDSRAYLYRDGALIQLTRDHTQVEMMLERGLLNAAEAADHPMKHVLGRAVGVEETLELDAIRDQIVLNDIFLLCSDGLHGVLDDNELVQLLREHGAAAAGPMIEACLAGGAPDNVTVTLVTANASTLLQLSGEFR